MPDNPACLATHRQILDGRCPWCDRRIENGHVSATLGNPAQIRWNWTAIEENLQDDDESIRSQSVLGLGDQAASLENTLPLFAIALNDREPQVRKLAEIACGQLARNLPGTSGVA